VSAPPLDLPVAIPRDEVIRLLGYPEGRPLPPRFVPLLDQALAAAAALVRPRGTFIRVAVAEAATVGLAPVSAAGLALGLVTIGADLEERVAELSRSGQATAALLLDAAGSAAAEAAADALGAVVVGGGAAATRPLACRISPGYGDWAIDEQRRLLARLDAASLGVTLLPSLMMVPRKSVSFAMWLGARQRIAGAQGCARCRLADCPYRRGGRPDGRRARPRS
jgi:hypothetical protein